MSKKIEKNPNPLADFCPELQAILNAELVLGNALSEKPRITDWPNEKSVFGALVYDLKSDKTKLQKGVRYSICTDPHYGWHDECYCEIHKHLLVAGSTHRFDECGGLSKFMGIVWTYFKNYRTLR